METGYIPNRSALFEKEGAPSNVEQEYRDTVYYDHTIPLIQDILFGLSDKDMEFISLDDDLNTDEVCI